MYRNAMGKLICALAMMVSPFATAGLKASPIPEKVLADIFKHAPTTWREYLVGVRAAERITDPLARCLAFPDLPGNRWPAGHAQAHCRYHFAYPWPSLADIAALIDGGKVAELESRLQDSLQRHFDTQQRSEDIHEIFNRSLFEPSAESDRITAKWLELAPESAFAQLARGSFLSRSAQAARGGKFAAETPGENMRRMSELVEQAIPFLEKAAQLNPQLMPAYTELYSLATFDSRADLQTSAFNRAQEMDPACLQLANVRMTSLRPRWGGDYQQMLSYANELSRHVADRPHLAAHMADPFLDRGSALARQDQYTSSTLQILETAIAIGSNEDALHRAADVAFNTTDAEPDQWKGLAYLLQESRFRENNAWGQHRIALALLHDEPEWGLRHALRAIALNPDNRSGNYLAGYGYYRLKRYADADREYAIAIESPNERQASLREVSEMWLVHAGNREAATKANPYIDRLLREYPDDGRGWLLDLRRRMVSGPVDTDMIKTVLGKVDRTDPWQAEKADALDKLLHGEKAPENGREERRSDPDVTQ